MTTPQVNTFSPITIPDIQQFQNYLPTAFSDNLTLLQKVNMVIQTVNSLGLPINTLIDQWNNQIIPYVTGDGLNQDVVNQLVSWKNDGTLDTIINQNVFNDLDSRISVEETKTTRLNNVAEYNATGDHTADQTTDLLNAISAITGQSVNGNTTDYKGGVIQLPSGVYTTSGLKFSSRIKIKGDGRGKTIIRLKDNANADLVQVPNNAFSCSLEDVTLDGNNANNTVGHGLHLLHNIVQYGVAPFNTLSDQFINKMLEGNTAYIGFRCRNVEVINSAEHGIYTEFSNYLSIFDKIYTFGNKKHGIYNGSTDCIFTNIFSERNGYAGVYETGSNNKWSNIKCLWNGTIDTSYGAFGITSQRGEFTNIESQDNHTDGFKLVGASNLSLINCIADSNGKNNDQSASTRQASGFRFENCKNINALGCTVDDYTLQALPDGFYATEYPIYMDENCFNMNVLDGIQVVGLNNSPSQILGRKATKNNDVLSYRNGTVTVDSQTFNNSDPALTSNGLTTQTNEECLVLAKPISGKSFTFVADLTLNTIADNSKLFQTSNGNFYVIVQNHTAEKSLGFVVKSKNGVTFDVYVTNLDYAYLLGKTVRIFARYTINDNGTGKANVGISYMDSTGRVYNSATNATKTGLDTDSYLNNSVRINPSSLNSLTVKRLMLSPQFAKSQYHYGEDITRLNNQSSIYCDFTNYAKEVNHAVALLPVASAYYQGMELWITGDNSTKPDKLYRCMKNTDGSFQWVTIGQGT